MMLNLDIRLYKKEDHNFILNSYIVSNSNKRTLPKWAYKKLHDFIENHLHDTIVVCDSDNIDKIIAYKIGEFTYIKHAHRERTSEINELLTLGEEES